MGSDGIKPGECLLTSRRNVVSIFFLEMKEGISLDA
jgi:hypothetical protein